jgi:uncharacterized protein with von Willebrand factor type A (vWA) domain
MPKPTQTHITLLVDRTASMAPHTHQVVDGLNHYALQLCRQAPGPVFGTLATFAEDVTVHYRQRPMYKVDKIRFEEYHPAGLTALYDAVVETMTTLPSMDRQRQIVIILSDGEDICSQASVTECADAISQAQARGVMVVFLGDGPEALMTADLLGISAACRYCFTARDGLRQVFTVLTTQTMTVLEHVVSKGLLPERFF